MTVARVARILGLFLLVAAVAPFVVHGVPEVVGGEQSFVVLTGSMQPNINPGDVVVVESVAPTAVARGDVVTFTRGSESVPTTHRVTEVEETADGLRYWTKGDNNEDPDPQPVTPDRLVGRVMLTIPYIGYAVQFVNTDQGFAALVVAPIALFVLNEVWLVATSVRGWSSGEADDGAVADDDPVVTADTADDQMSTEPSEPSESSGPSGPVRPSESTTTTAMTAETVAAADEAVAEATSGYSISRGELRLAIVALAAFTGYSVWVATQLTEGWSVAVVAGTGASTLLLCGLYYAAGPSGSEDSASASPAAVRTPESSPTEQGVTDGGTEPAEPPATGGSDVVWEVDDADA